jgi:transketolase
MVQSLIDAVENGVNVAVVVSDSTSTAKIVPFAERFPDRLINVGIAEQNLVGVAVGLSLGGYVAVTANAAPFLVARANEQVKNDVCYSQANVKLVGLNAGVSYGPLASTHHAIDDISIMRGLANIIILVPADPVETRRHSTTSGRST